MLPSRLITIVNCMAIPATWDAGCALPYIIEYYRLTQQSTAQKIRHRGKERLQLQKQSQLPLDR